MKQHLRLRRSLLAVLLLGIAGTSLVAGPVHSSSAARLHDTPAGGTDLWHLDTATEHYTQVASGLRDLTLYNTPVGIPDVNGWHLRDTTLGAPAPDGTVAPVNLPFGLHIATHSSASTLAALTNEDGVSLGVGLTSIGGAAPTNVPGQIGTNAVTFNAPVATSPSDVAVRATLSGVNVEVTLHSANESGQIVLALAPDSRTYLSQETNGAIRVTRPITVYGDNAEPSVTLQPEYYVETPSAIDSSAAEMAQVSAGPVALKLAPTATGLENLTVSVDAAWLHDPQRVFPVRLTVPIVTAYSAAHTGLLDTLNSCAAAGPAPQTDVVVGKAGACTYHGLLYFDTTSLPYNTPIVSAVLHLYTPAQTSPIDVQVFPNLSPATATGLVWHPAPSAPPSWSTAPPVIAGAAGIEQSGNAGGWQTWDVTSLVRQWVQNAKANGGMTLESSGAPVRFAVPLAAGSTDPTLAPYLDIMFNPHPTSTQPLYSDGADSILGVSGTFDDCTTLQCDRTSGPLSVDWVGALHLSGNYIRIGAKLNCSGGMPTPTITGTDTLANILYGSPNSAYRNGLIPIVNFVPNPQCLQFSTPGSWSQQVGYFVAHMGYPTSSPIYFEIGNEPSTTAAPPGSTGGCNTDWGEYAGCTAQDYENVYASAAQSLQSAMGSSTTYRVLTGGMLEATADMTCTDPGGTININASAAAISEAEGAPYSVNPSHLGVAVHPYTYNTNETGNPAYWRNYYHEYPGTAGYRGYGGVCGDLNGMLNLWIGQFPGMPVIFTEDNWSATPTKAPDVGHCEDNGTNAGCGGTYLVDLYTWLADHPASGSYADPTTSVVRLQWFTGIDFPNKPLGLYTSSGAVKPFSTGTCPSNANVAGYKNISDDYTNLRFYGPCY